MRTPIAARRRTNDTPGPARANAHRLGSSGVTGPDAAEVEERANAFLRTNSMLVAREKGARAAEPIRLRVLLVVALTPCCRQ
ncbi:hypothetical protein GFH48_02335 [Streptomyces fagopyri]|uniref:Uncharacterized protein n=1 Tax=Streptomyces fagopyri TaxID=2662397 RepID=A0A5Q0L5T6_9ACTN|nr:hypothetical protein [Streptomyces fagopyri]QFZ72248.1 hypothetical protein GFH48_02335 [Streptomyces fagopyri]